MTTKKSEKKTGKKVMKLRDNFHEKNGRTCQFTLDTSHTHIFKAYPWFN